MMMRTILSGTALSIAWGVAVWANEREFVSPVMSAFETGIICAQETGVTREAPDTVAGTTHVLEETPPFVSNRRTVPAVLGIGFGVRTAVVGELGVEGITITLTHPPFAGSGATQQSFVSYVGPSSDPSVTFYQFDYPYELALGPWTMSGTTAGGELLFETEFTVVSPGALPDLANTCGYEDLIG